MSDRPTSSSFHLSRDVAPSRRLSRGVLCPFSLLAAHAFPSPAPMPEAARGLPLPGERRDTPPPPAPHPPQPPANRSSSRPPPRPAEGTNCERGQPQTQDGGRPLGRASRISDASPPPARAAATRAAPTAADSQPRPPAGHCGCADTHADAALAPGLERRGADGTKFSSPPPPPPRDLARR